MLPTSTDVEVQLKEKIPVNADAVVALIHKEIKPADAGFERLPREDFASIERLMEARLVTGKSNELTVQLSSAGKNRRLIVIGLGNHAKFSAECLREAAGTLAKAAKKHKLRNIALLVPPTPDTMPGRPDAGPAGAGKEVAVESLAVGFLLASFEFRDFKGAAEMKKDNEKPGRVELTLVAPSLDDRPRRALERGRAIADGQNFARTIASRPGNDINPPALAKVAQQLASDVGLNVRILDERQMEKLGMGGILAVGRGSQATPPRMIVLEHKNKGSGVRGQGSAKKGKAAQPNKPLLVVGKAITFDTGGISIKPAERMGRMIFDKCGGMAVLGLMYAIAKLKLPIHVVGILASAENHISETAYRPGDILKMYNGVTVEVTNTDAEGRLVLGDALAWGIETFDPAAVVELSTLTGGVVTALGKTMAGVMAMDDAIVKDLTDASAAAGERIWRLPLGEEQREQMKSEYADILNAAGREAHPLQGGAFLSYFVPENLPFAHLDIAGVADTEKETHVYRKGATGWGVRTLVNWVTAKVATEKHAMPRAAGG